MSIWFLCCTLCETYISSEHAVFIKPTRLLFPSGCMELSVAKQLLKDLEVASHSLVLMGSLHLLYLVTPHDYAGLRPDYRHYYTLVRKIFFRSLLGPTQQYRLKIDLELIWILKNRSTRTYTHIHTALRLHLIEAHISVDIYVPLT